MINSLPIVVQKEWEFLQSQSHLTARLLRIGHLLHALELSKETAQYYAELNQEIHAKRAKAMECTKHSMKWLGAQFDKLAQSSWIDLCQLQSADFKDLMEGKKGILGISVVRQGRDLLIEAVSKCPELKIDPEFNELFCKNNNPTEISWPDYLLDSINNSMPDILDEYERTVTSMPVDLLDYLQLLAEYSSNDGLQSVQSFMKAQMQSVESWQTIEIINCQLLLKIYFQRFESKNNKNYPLSDERFLKLVKALLDLFVLHIESNSLLCGPQLKRKLSKDAEKFCTDVLLGYMQRMKSTKLKRFTYEKMLAYCIKEARGKPFLQSISKTMIERIGPSVRKMLENQGIDIRVVRGKAS